MEGEGNGEGEGWEMEERKGSGEIGVWNGTEWGRKRGRGEEIKNGRGSFSF